MINEYNVRFGNPAEVKVELLVEDALKSKRAVCSLQIATMLPFELALVFFCQTCDVKKIQEKLFFIFLFSDPLKSEVWHSLAYRG